MDFAWFFLIIPITLAWILFFLFATVDNLPNNKDGNYVFSAAFAILMFTGVGTLFGSCVSINKVLRDKDRWEKPVVLKQIEEDGTQYALIREGNTIEMMNLNVYFKSVIPKDAKVVSIKRVYGPYVGNLYFPQTIKYEVVK